MDIAPSFTFSPIDSIDLMMKSFHISFCWFSHFIIIFFSSFFSKWIWLSRWLGNIDITAKMDFDWYPSTIKKHDQMKQCWSLSLHLPWWREMIYTCSTQSIYLLVLMNAIVSFWMQQWKKLLSFSLMSIIIVFFFNRECIIPILILYGIWKLVQKFVSMRLFERGRRLFEDIEKEQKTFR